MISVIFLLGAGASVNAGMPLVAQLTTELRDRLPYIRDINGERRTEFLDLFNALAEYEPGIRSNYERFFEWLRFLVQGQSGSFKKAVTFSLDQRLVDAAPFLIFSIKQPILEILRSRHQCATYQPGYFARLGDFLSQRSRLKVFTTNYDLCVEDACRSKGIDIGTGFHRSTGRWSPSLFRNEEPGINLYKLHGSLNWGLNDNLQDQFLVERYPPEWNNEPELLLGPGSKLQHDDPFVTLYSEFHEALRQVSTCVAIGYSFNDSHIEEPIRQASRRGMKVIDVNPSRIVQRFERYKNIPTKAKAAFESGEIVKAVIESDSDRK
jgi:NAD-dependent SIR2 family protein deacetylase